MDKESPGQLYAVNLPTLDECCAYLQGQLGIAFEARENASYGDYFVFEVGYDQRLLLIENELDDGEPAELDLPEFRFLLYFFYPDKHPDIAALLPQCVDAGKLTLVALLIEARVVPVRKTS
jgi:hypothetical protein